MHVRLFFTIKVPKNIGLDQSSADSVDGTEVLIAALEWPVQMLRKYIRTIKNIVAISQEISPYPKHFPQWRDTVFAWL